MIPFPDGSYRATVSLKCKPGQLFQWGVRDQDGHWMLFENEAIAFLPETSKSQSFRLGNRHWLGIHRNGEDGYRAGVWAPHAKRAQLLIQLDSGECKVELAQSGDIWGTESDNGWAAMEGQPYGFVLYTKCGHKVLRADPYARVRQGPQRGLSDLFLTGNGEYSHRYNKEHNKHHLLRFEAVLRDGKRLRHPPTLRFFKNGRKLKSAALKRLLSRQSPPLPQQEEWWLDHLQKDGSVQLKKHPKAKAYSICLGPAAALEGLHYEIHDHQGHAYHDPWCNEIDGHHNWARLGIVAEPCSADRKLAPSRPVEDMRMYELHVGSLLGTGDNLRTSTLGEVAAVLPEIKRAGFNTICLMPTNSTEGWREWGYLGTSTLAHQEAFADPHSNAEESLVSFVNQAHKLKLRVLNDVVYNHVGGFHNDLWEFDGLGNSWFEREPEPKRTRGKLPYRPLDTVECTPRTKNPTVRGTPWGMVPAFNKAPVYQFYIDHAMDQVQRMGFDGIRFDFTNLIHSVGAGDKEGWNMLRGLHLRLRYFFPNTVTFAEEFPPHPIITTPVEEGGAGFSGMWNTEHQHRLIFHHHKPSITQNMVEDCLPQLHELLQHITFPEGFATPCTSATVLSNHDEVGNAHRLYLLVRNHPRGLDIARLVSWFSLLCPGHPILFQGTEDLASNYFSWGLPHTWDVDGHLGNRRLHKYRLNHLESLSEVLKLRAKSQDLWAGNVVQEHYLDPARHLLAIRRGRFWIVGNFGRTAWDVPEPIAGNAKLVANSERKKYGYLGKATRGNRIGGYALKVWKLNC